MRQNLILLFLALVSCFQTFAQEQVKHYVQNNLKPIKSIQPDYTDDSDLEEISKAIGDSRIVMLGEQDHGDGATMLAKTRLVKFLHEKKGFNVLAFEGDFFALNQGWEATSKEEEEIKKFLYQNIYPTWSVCKECETLLYNYIPQTYQSSQPLKISGFDSQLVGLYSRGALKIFIDEYLHNTNIDFIRSKTYDKFFLPYLDTLRNPNLSGKQSKELIFKKQHSLTRFISSLDSLTAQLSAKKSQGFETLIFQSLKAQAVSRNYYLLDNLTENINARDSQMARNLDWLVNVKYANEKIIVWAANAHISKGAPGVNKWQAAKPIDWMGSVFTKNPINENQTYIIGFDSKKGFNKRISAKKASKVSLPKKDGFETWIDNNLPFAFIDFKSFRKQNPTYSNLFEMKGIGHSSRLALWTNIYDGIFYIHTMTPCGIGSFKPAITKK